MPEFDIVALMRSVDLALAHEGLLEETRTRVLNRLVWGDHRGAIQRVNCLTVESSISEKQIAEMVALGPFMSERPPRVGRAGGVLR